jgi:hypothetical protein
MQHTKGGAVMNKPTSRRAILASAAALPALAIPIALATAEPDPIFALIEEHKSANAAYAAALARVPQDGSPFEAFEALSDAAGDVAHDVMEAILTTAPTTVAGAVTLLRYLQAARAHDPDGQDYLRHVCGDGEGHQALVASLIACLAPLAVQS